jgi:hypothetical protein
MAMAISEIYGTIMAIFEVSPITNQDGEGSISSVTSSAQPVSFLLSYPHNQPLQRPPTETKIAVPH